MFLDTVYTNKKKHFDKDKTQCVDKDKDSHKVPIPRRCDALHAVLTSLSRHSHATSTPLTPIPRPSHAAVTRLPRHVAAAITQLPLSADAPLTQQCSPSHAPPTPPPMQRNDALPTPPTQL